MLYHVTYHVMMLKLLDAELEGIFFVGGVLLTTTWPFALLSVIDGPTGRPLVSAAIAGLYDCIVAILESMDGDCAYSRFKLLHPCLGQTTSPKTSLLAAHKQWTQRRDRADTK